MKNGIRYIDFANQEDCDVFATSINDIAETTMCAGSKRYDDGGHFLILNAIEDNIDPSKKDDLDTVISAYTIEEKEFWTMVGLGYYPIPGMKS